MFSFRKRGKLNTHYPRIIKFICEQEGIPERKLKEDLFHLFKKSSDINRAYLARVKYDTATDYNVALCLAASGEKGDLIAKISEIFKRKFSKNIHMDIIFLTESQEDDLKKVCQPFYDSADQI